MLCFVRDVDGLLDQLERLARRGVFVTCYQDDADLVHDSLERRPGVSWASFGYVEHTWEAAWWSPATPS
jgi:hypothetical protein